MGDDDNGQVVGNIMGNPSISHSVLLQQPVVTNQFVETDQSDVVLPDDNDSMDVEETPNDLRKIKAKKQKKADKNDKTSAFGSSDTKSTKPYNFAENMEN